MNVLVLVKVDETGLLLAIVSRGSRSPPHSFWLRKKQKQKITEQRKAGSTRKPPHSTAMSIWRFQ